ncbi:MAG: hypothetical protein ACK55O_06770 [Phycisphaerales bacterium]|jgi:hypothetical protein|nr:hypothetical protein [Phycisphaeraceae bacterium]
MKTAIAMLVVAGAAAAAQADVVAYWNFNDAPSAANTFNAGQVGPLTLAPAQGSGSISLASGLILNTAAANAAANGNVGSFGGTTTGGVSGEVAGFALTITAGIAGVGTAPFAANGGQVIFSINTSSVVSGLTFSYATRGTGTGFNAQNWAYSTDGGTNWINTTSYSGTLTATYVLRTVALPASGAAYGNSNLLVRLTVSGATSAAGNNRIDNVLVEGVIPTPASAAVLGLGGLIAARRRRA